MTRRRWFYRIAAVLAVAAALTAVMAYRTPAGNNATVSVAAPDHGAVATGSARHARYDPRLPAAPHGKVDIARVELALARMQATTARFTADQIAEEQKHMLEAKARFEAIRVPEPKTREFTDELGIRWTELRYESGEVRYMLAPTPEHSPTGTPAAK